ncbi:biogenesis of lysosome- organelles complex 1 subunit 1 [Paramecium bursaria]
MFDQILKEYDKNRVQLEKQDEALKRQLHHLSEPMTKKILHGLNTNVSILHANEQIIEKETKQLLKDTAALQKESQQWAQMYNQLNEVLKKVGDIANFAQVIETELRDIVEK